MPNNEKPWVACYERNGREAQKCFATLEEARKHAAPHGIDGEWEAEAPLTPHYANAWNRSHTTTTSVTVFYKP